MPRHKLILVVVLQRCSASSLIQGMQAFDVLNSKHIVIRRPSTEFTYTGGPTSEGGSKQNH